MPSKYPQEGLDRLKISTGKTGEQSSEGIEGYYQDYCNTIGEHGAIIADDRQIWTTPKTDRMGRKFPLCRDWRKCPALEVKKRYEHEGRIVCVWGYCYAIVRYVPALQGTRITIQGNSIKIELHNILNRYPHKSRLSLFIQVLEQLHDFGILRPGSRSSYYRLAGRFRTDLEIRWDCRKDYFTDRRIGKLRGCALDEVTDKNGAWTLYFTPMGTQGARLRLYPYEGFMRFEIILRDCPRKGTFKKIYPGERVKSTLSRHKDLAFQIRPILANAVYLEDCGLSGEALFNLSQPRNQYSKKYF